MYFLLLEKARFPHVFLPYPVCCRLFELEVLLISRKLYKDLLRVVINQCQYPISSINFRLGIGTLRK